jgi:hydrogenase expression/formation protein HypC
MCLGIPGRLVEIINDDFRIGTVEVSGVRGSVSLALLTDEIAVGDWVLVHVGFALARIDEQDAERTLAWLEGMGQAYADELQSFEASRIHAAERRTAGDRQS